MTAVKSGVISGTSMGDDVRIVGYVVKVVVQMRYDQNNDRSKGI